MVTFNPLFASVVGSNELESKIYADVSNFYGLSRAPSNEELAKRLASATTTSNSLAIAVNTPIFRPIPVVKTSQSIAQTQTYHTLANAFQNQTKLIELPNKLVSTAIQEAENQVSKTISEPIKHVNNLAMTAVIAFIFYLVLVRR